MTTTAEPRADLAALTLDPSDTKRLEGLIQVAARLTEPLEQALQSEAFAALAMGAPPTP